MFPMLRLIAAKKKHQNSFVQEKGAEIPPLFTRLLCAEFALNYLEVKAEVRAKISVCITWNLISEAITTVSRGVRVIG